MAPSRNVDYKKRVSKTDLNSPNIIAYNGRYDMLSGNGMMCIKNEGKSFKQSNNVQVRLM